MGNRRKSTASIGTPRKRGAPSRRPSLPQLIQRMSTKESAKRAAHAGKLKDALARLRVELQSLDNDITAVQVRHKQNGDRAALGVDDAPTTNVLRDIVNVAPTKPADQEDHPAIAPRPTPLPMRPMPVPSNTRTDAPVTAAAAAKDASSYESVLRAHNHSTQLRAHMHNAADALSPQTPPRTRSAAHVAVYPIIGTNDAISTASAALANSRMASAAVSSCVSTPTAQRHVPATPRSTYSTPGVHPPSLPITPLKTISLSTSPSCLSTPRTPVTPHAAYMTPPLNLATVLPKSPHVAAAVPTAVPVMSVTHPLPATPSLPLPMHAIVRGPPHGSSDGATNSQLPAPPAPAPCTAGAPASTGVPNTQIYTPATFTALAQYREQ